MTTFVTCVNIAAAFVLGTLYGVIWGERELRRIKKLLRAHGSIELRRSHADPDSWTVTCHGEKLRRFTVTHPTLGAALKSAVDTTDRGRWDELVVRDTAASKFAVLDDSRGDTAQMKCLSCGHVFDASPVGEIGVVPRKDGDRTYLVTECPQCGTTDD